MIPTKIKSQLDAGRLLTTLQHLLNSSRALSPSAKTEHVLLASERNVARSYQHCVAFIVSSNILFSMYGQ
jgi:hypothetical protein